MMGTELTNTTYKWYSTYLDQGSIKLTVKKLDGTVVIDFDRKNIDMWRDGDFVRPKWGIYRGKSEQLRKEEEEVRFANFSITRGKIPLVDCVRIRK